LNRNDGRVLSDPVCNDDGEVVKLPAIFEQDSSVGIVADELITLGVQSTALPQSESIGLG
jgi:hypothetical protein